MQIYKSVAAHLISCWLDACLGCDLIHKLVIVFLVWTLVVKDTNRAYEHLAEFISLQTDFKLAERLSLVPDLIYYGVECC